MTIFKFELGAQVKDRISGYEGIITGRYQYLNGCVQYGVRAQGLHDGKPIASQAFDEQRLELMGEGIPGPSAEAEEQRPGGPGKSRSPSMT